MVVGHDNSAGVVLDGCYIYFSRMNNSVIHESDRNDVDLDYFVGTIEGDGKEAFIAGSSVTSEGAVDVRGRADLVGRGCALTDEFVNHRGLLLDI